MASEGISDRVKRLAILGIFSDGVLRQQLVLKGGNLLDVVYGVSTRSSQDLDFSMDGEFSHPDEVRHHLLQCLGPVFQEAGFIVFDVQVAEKPDEVSEDIRDFWGGYQAFFKII